jgi:hypothetical protein
VVLVIAAAQHDPAMGIFRSSSPTGKSLLGKTVDDEVTISMGDQSRSATILAIEKKESARVSTETPVVRERTVMQPDPQSERGTRTTSLPLHTPKAEYPEPEMPQTPDQDRRSVVPGRTSGNRVIEELRALDARFGNPRCSQCSGIARLAVNNQGPVVTCASGGCKKVERVDVHTLQRLADRLGVTCYQCNGTHLVSLQGPISNYLKCRDDGANTSWQAISHETREGPAPRPHRGGTSGGRQKILARYCCFSNLRHEQQDESSRA